MARRKAATEAEMTEPKEDPKDIVIPVFVFGILLLFISVTLVRFSLQGRFDPRVFAASFGLIPISVLLVLFIRRMFRKSAVAKVESFWDLVFMVLLVLLVGVVAYAVFCIPSYKSYTLTMWWWLCALVFRSYLVACGLFQVEKQSLARVNATGERREGE